MQLDIHENRLLYAAANFGNGWMDTYVAVEYEHAVLPRIRCSAAVQSSDYLEQLLPLQRALSRVASSCRATHRRRLERE